MLACNQNCKQGPETLRHWDDPNLAILYPHVGDSAEKASQDEAIRSFWSMLIRTTDVEWMIAFERDMYADKPGCPRNDRLRRCDALTTAHMRPHLLYCFTDLSKFLHECGVIR